MPTELEVAIANARNIVVGDFAEDHGAFEEAVNGGALTRQVCRHATHSANIFLEFLYLIRQRMEPPIKAREFYDSLDNAAEFEDARFRGIRISLIHAITNALKHGELDKRHNRVLSETGNIDFQCLRVHDGIVLFETDRFRFDYARVALRPILTGIASLDDADNDVYIDIALGKEPLPIEYGWDHEYPNEPEFAIDNLILACNPICRDCGEGEDLCQCEMFEYQDEKGEFRTLEIASHADIDHWLSQVTGER